MVSSIQPAHANQAGHARYTTPRTAPSLSVSSSLPLRRRRRLGLLGALALATVLALAGFYALGALRLPANSGAAPAAAWSPPAMVADAAATSLRAELARLHWSDGVTARDQAADALRAGQHFARAAALDPDTGEARQARLALALLLGPLRLESLLQHPQVSGASLSVDQTRVLTWGGDGMVQLWDTASGQPVLPPLTHQGRVYGTAFGPKTQRILTWSEDGTARVWNAATGQPVTPPLAHEGEVFGAVFDDQEMRVLTWSEDGTARLWDASTGAAVTPPFRHDGPVSGARFSADEQQLYTWSWDPIHTGNDRVATSTLQRWNIASGAPSLPTIYHGGRINGVTFSRDEQRMLVWSGDGTARVWDATTGKAISAPLRQQGWLNGARFSADESRVLTWSEDGTARVWSVAESKPLTPLLTHDGEISGAMFSPDEARILTWSLDGTARLWDANTGRLLTPPLVHQGWIHGAAFTDAGRTVLTWGEDGMLRLWDSVSGQPLSPPLPHGAAISGVQLASTGGSVLTWSRNGLVRLWRTAAETRPTTLPTAPTPTETTLQWSADGQALLTDTATHQSYTLPIAREDWIHGMVLSADQSRLLVWGGDLFGGIAHVRSSHDGQPLTPLLKHGDRISGGLFSADNRLVVTWSEDGEIRIWDGETGAALAAPMRHRGRVLGARLSSDGQRLLSWSLDGTARLWDSRNGQPISAALVHNSGVYSAAFAADESQLYTWSLDGTARIWQTVAPTDWPLERLSLWLEVVTGTRLGDYGTLDLLDITAWRERKALYDEQKAILATRPSSDAG